MLGAESLRQTLVNGQYLRTDGNRVGLLTGFVENKRNIKKLIVRKNKNLSMYILCILNFAEVSVIQVTYRMT